MAKFVEADEHIKFSEQLEEPLVQSSKSSGSM
jgi:hypothetical protein